MEIWKEQLRKEKAASRLNEKFSLNPKTCTYIKFIKIVKLFIKMLVVVLSEKPNKKINDESRKKVQKHMRALTLLQEDSGSLNTN